MYVSNEFEFYYQNKHKILSGFQFVNQYLSIYWLIENVQFKKNHKIRIKKKFFYHCILFFQKNIDF